MRPRIHHWDTGLPVYIDEIEGNKKMGIQTEYTDPKTKRTSRKVINNSFRNLEEEIQKPIPENKKNKLYLAKFTLITTRYMNEDEEKEEIVRLVYAKDENQAEKKIEKAYPDDAYSVYYNIRNLILTETIGDE
jgi:hypothetical protein